MILTYKMWNIHKHYNHVSFNYVCFIVNKYYYMCFLLPPLWECCFHICSCFIFCTDFWNCWGWSGNETCGIKTCASTIPLLPCFWYIYSVYWSSFRCWATVLNKSILQKRQNSMSCCFWTKLNTYTLSWACKLLSYYAGIIC